jgi:hypothetical protein
MDRAQICSKMVIVLWDCIIRVSQPVKVNTNGEMVQSILANLKMVEKMDSANGRRGLSNKVTNMRATSRMI